MTLSLPEAEVIALKILGFLVSDPDRAGRFLKLTGLTANDLRTNAGDRLFLAGVVEHLLADESLLIVFAEDNGIDPRLPAMTVAVLRGRNAV